MPYRSLDASAVLAKCVEHGVPVVGSRVGVIPEWITDRRDGLLAPPGDPAALAVALSALLGEPGLAQALAKGVETLRARLPGWPECAERTREVYRQARAGRA
jgi:glycosyltransferase involved in cell wall biosynthesis